MRIIAGRAGGLVIKAPPAVTRPTSDRVREAVFSMLGEIVADARVLDLFAGSGAMGIESLSRGAREALFVEHHGGACRIIEDNLKRVKLDGGRVVKSDAFAALRKFAESGVQFHLVFADPPYAKKQGDTDFAAELLANGHLRAVLAPGGIFVLETMVTKPARRVIAGWNIVRDREYGSTRILTLQPHTTPAPHGETSDPAAL
jgi:16S rRNA (guanine966-N2)-methyltransferase